MLKILLHLENHGEERPFAEIPDVGDYLVLGADHDADWYEVERVLYSPFHEGTDRDAEVYTRRLDPMEQARKRSEGRAPIVLS